MERFCERCRHNVTAHFAARGCALCPPPWGGESCAPVRKRCPASLRTEGGTLIQCELLGLHETHTTFLWLTSPEGDDKQVEVRW
jgi:hypothetical protein